MSAGESEDKVEGMDRPALKEAVAQQKVAATARDVNTELEVKKLELEMRKMEMEEKRLERERDGERKIGESERERFKGREGEDGARVPHETAGDGWEWSCAM